VFGRRGILDVRDDSLDLAAAEIRCVGRPGPVLCVAGRFGEEDDEGLEVALGGGTRELAGD
jgi:hypothetical protein